MFEINPNKKKKQRETGRGGVEQRFVLAVKKAGGKAFKFTSEMNRGVSDRIVVFPGQVWFVEIKRENGKLTPLQQEFKNFIQSLQINYFTVYGERGITNFLKKVKENKNARQKI